MRRRTVLAAIGPSVVPLVGCTGLGNPDTASVDTDTETPTPTIESRVDVPPCPETPDSFTRETALQFATKFEKAYVVRQTLRKKDRIVSISVSIGEERNVTNADVGWIVRFTATGPAYRYLPGPSSTETQHVDPAYYGVNYFVSNRTVRRAPALPTKEVDPRVSGPVLNCPPDAEPNLQPVKLSVTGKSVAAGETATLTISGATIGSLQFYGDIPEGWGDVGTVLGSPTFDPPFDGAEKSLPPVYFWNPYADAVDGTYPIDVPESAATGEYVFTFLANCHHSGFCESATRAHATVTVTK